MRLSVVIPAFDFEATITEAIRSALDSTHDDLEVIVVDDGSRDATLARARSLHDPRLRVLAQPNGGVIAARRRGLAESRGDAVVFLDGDDRLRPDALARFARRLEERPETGVAYGDRVLMAGDGRVFGSERGALWNPRPEGDVLARVLRRNFLSTPGQACFRTAVLRDATAMRLDVRRGADWILYAETAATTRFSWLGRGPVVEYRIAATSMARSLAGGGAGIEDLAPALDAIYSLRAVRERFPPGVLARFRRETEASAWAWKGQELLRARRWRASRACFVEAIRRSAPRVDPRDLICLALTLLGRFPPGTRRYVGVP